MTARRVPYLSGVDGLRAVAVIAVVLYHADVSWLPGGFLGVDVFFAISGYLIATLLLLEHARHGGRSRSVRSGCGGRVDCCQRCSRCSPARRSLRSSWRTTRPTGWSATSQPPPST